MFSFGVFKKVGGLSSNRDKINQKIEGLALELCYLKFDELNTRVLYEDISSIFGFSGGKLLFSKDYLLGLSMGFYNYLFMIKDELYENKRVFIEKYLKNLLEKLILSEAEAELDESRNITQIITLDPDML